MALTLENIAVELCVNFSKNKLMQKFEIKYSNIMIIICHNFIL
jgi:hypothetical protein